MLKKVLLGVGISLCASSIYVYGFSKSVVAQIDEMLTKSWSLHTHKDEIMLEKFIHIVDSLTAHSPVIEAKLELYKQKFGIATREELIKKIFLLRSQAHMDSLYTAIDEFEDLSDETKLAITNHVGATYKVVVENSVEQNLALLQILAQRHSDQDNAIVQLPEAFKEVTSQLEGEELSSYLEVLYNVHFNTIRLILILSSEPKKDEL